MQQEKENVQVGWQVLMFTGVRVNALTHHSSMQEPGWLDLLDEDGTEGGGRVPMPLDMAQGQRDEVPTQRSDPYQDPQGDGH